MEMVPLDEKKYQEKKEEKRYKKWWSTRGRRHHGGVGRGEERLHGGWRWQRYQGRERERERGGMSKLGQVIVILMGVEYKS